MCSEAQRRQGIWGRPLESERPAQQCELGEWVCGAGVVGTHVEEGLG